MSAPRRSRISLAGVVFAVLLAQVLLYPGIDRLVTRLGAETELGASTWFLAAEFAAFVVFAGPWGALSDATGRRTSLIALGAVGGAAGYAALAWLPGVVSLPFAAVLALRALQGAATVGAFSIALATLADLGGGQGRNMGTAGIAIGLGTALGAPVGGQLYALSTLAPLWVAAVLLLLAGVLTLTVPRAPNPEAGSEGGASSGNGADAGDPDDADGAGDAGAGGADEAAPVGDDRGTGEGVLAALSGVARRPLLALPYAFGFIDRLTAGFFALVGTLYFRAAFGLDPAGTGVMLALFFAPFALLQYPFGLLSDRVGRTTPIVVGSALYGLGVFAVGLASTVELAGASMVVVGVLGALMAPATLALVADLVPPGERGAAMGGFNVFGSVGFLAGIVVGGGVAGEFGYLVAFLVAGGLELLLAAVTLPVFLRADVDRTSVFANG